MNSSIQSFPTSDLPSAKHEDKRKFLVLVGFAA
jgi:hypothetical protein